MKANVRTAPSPRGAGARTATHPARTRAVAASAGEELDTAAWRDSLTTPRAQAEDTRKTLECRQAARWLAQWLRDSEGRKPSEVMVLARRRERLGLMQAELAALHIPAQQPEKTDLCDMPEVQDLVALLDVLVSHQHDLSLARALKSPLFGASDDDLVQLTQRRTCRHRLGRRYHFLVAVLARQRNCPPCWCPQGRPCRPGRPGWIRCRPTMR